MIKYNIIIWSKNNQSLKFFILFLNKINQPKINLSINYKKLKTLIKKISLLKSPHVNKKAQKHFEYRIFTKKINIYLCYNNIKFLIFLKKIKTQLFPEIKIKINFYFNNIFSKNLLNPKNYFINSINKNKINNKNIKSCLKIKNYLQILDCYGEFNLIKNLKV